MVRTHEAGAGTELRMAPHQEYLVSGRIYVVMADGTEFETAAGEVMSIPPAHDAWAVGNDPVVAIDRQGATVWVRAQQG